MASVPPPSQDIGFLPYVKPIQLGRWEQTKKTIWNSETNEFLGRTANSWGGILVFYIIFYAGLAALFAICMHGMFYTLSEDTPTWTLDESIIGTNPGMGFRPISEDIEEDGALIWYTASNETNVQYWTQNLDNFLEPYRHKGGPNQMVCDYSSPPPYEKVCLVDVNKYGACTSENSYGFNRSKPCVFIKLNRIFNWVPDYYTDPKDLPKDMPEELKNHIATLSANNETERLNTVWVTCEGENPADRENIGEVAYYPEHGLPGFYYPYRNTKGYLSPLVAVQLLRPKLNVLINIECKAWAKNVIYSNAKNQREGSVHLEVMID